MARLNRLRLARARPGGGGGASNIIPNIVQAATVVPGLTTTGFTAPIDSGGRAHFIEYTVVALSSTQATNPRAFVFCEIGDDDGVGSGGWGYYNGGAPNQLTASSRNLAGVIAGNQYPTAGNMTAPAQWAVGARIRTQLTPDKRMQLVINDVIGWDQDWSAGYNGEPNDRGVFMHIPAGASVKDLTYGQYNIPLSVQNQQLVAGYVPQTVLKYTGSPYGYRVQIETSGGAVLVPSAPVVIVLNTQGSLLVQSPTGAPVSAFGSSVNVRWIEVDANGNTVRSVVESSQMPDQPPRFGMNMIGFSSSYPDRMYKDLLYASYWANGNTSIPFTISGGGINTAYFNQQGQITTMPASGDMRRRILRPTVPGARVRLEWKGYTASLLNQGGNGANISVVQTANGVNYVDFDYNFSWADQGPAMFISITAVDTSVTDRFVRCAEVGTTWNGLVFDDTWIARMSKYNVLRYMDLMGSNADLPYGRNWDVERPRADVYGVQQLGMPPEHIAEISNRTGTTPWINLPAVVKNADAAFGYQYTVKFVRGLLFGEGMSGGVKLNSTAAGRLLIEIGNEWFNAFFSIYNSAAQTALDEGRATATQFNTGGKYEAVKVEEAYQVNRHFQALTDSLTPTELQAIVRIVGHNPNTSSFGSLVNGITGANSVVYKVESGNYEAMTCAFYFGATMNNSASNSGLDNAYTTNLDTLFERYNTLLDGSFNQTLLVKNYAKSKGKRFMMYEGQGHYVPGYNGTGTEWYNPTLYAAFNQDDRQRIAIRRWANLAASGYGDVMCAYYEIGPNGPSSAQYGNWGFLTDPQGLATSPKMLGYLQAKADQGV